MTVDNKIINLYNEYKNSEGDESCYRHLADYLIEELEKELNNL